LVSVEPEAEIVTLVWGRLDWRDADLKANGLLGRADMWGGFWGVLGGFGDLFVNFGVIFFIWANLINHESMLL